MVELGSLCLEPSDELGVFGQACVDGDGEEGSEGKQVGCVKLKGEHLRLGKPLLSKSMSEIVVERQRIACLRGKKSPNILPKRDKRSTL
jgi:hypothetical protein